MISLFSFLHTGTAFMVIVQFSWSFAGPIISCFTRSKRVNKIYAYALARKKPGLHAKFIGAMVSEFRFFKHKKMKKNTANLRKLCFPVFWTSHHPFFFA